jgi:hypothetical protein
MRAIQANLEAELHNWLQLLGDQFLPADEYLRRDNLTGYWETQMPIGHCISPWGDWESTLTPIKIPTTPHSLSLDATIGELFSYQPAKALLERNLPKVIFAIQAQMEGNEEVKIMPLRLLLQMYGARVEDLKRIDTDLAKLPPPRSL